MPPRSQLTYTRFPYTPLFRSRQRQGGEARRRCVLSPRHPRVKPYDSHTSLSPTLRPSSRPSEQREREPGPMAEAGHQAQPENFDLRWRRSAAEAAPEVGRSEEHTSELQSLMRTSYAVFCLKKKNNTSHA